MTKTDLIAHLADSHHLSRVAATAIVNDIAAIQRDTLLNTGGVILQELGRLKVTHRNARTGRNPKTGEAIAIPETYTVKFTVTKDLKTALNS